jgi:hypothetical protein
MKYKEQFDSLSKRMIIIKKKERKGKNKNASLIIFSAETEYKLFKRSNKANLYIALVQ